MSGSIIETINKFGIFFCDHALRMLIQSSILIAALFVIDLFIRKRIKAVLRYCLWLLVFVKLVTPTTLSLPTGLGYWLSDLLPAKSAPKEIIQQPNAEHFTQPLIQPNFRFINSGVEPHPTHIHPAYTPVVEAPVTTPPAPSVNTQGGIFLAWIVGELILVSLLLQRTFFVRRIVAQSKPAESKLQDLLSESCRKIGIKKKIELKISKSLLSPAACGLLKPKIILPHSLLKCFSTEKLRTTILHELAHIKRKDIWINSLQTFLQILYFYNPFLWFANTIVRRIREQAVDETVLVYLGEKADTYSRTLVDIAEIAFAKPSLGLNMIGVVESKKALTGRIKHILTRPFPKTVKLGAAGILAIILAALVLLPMARGQREVEANNTETGWSEATNGLRWRISLPSDKIVIDKPIVVDMEFQNFSDNPLRILKSPNVTDNLYPTLYTSDGFRNGYPIDHMSEKNIQSDETILIEPGEIYKSSWSKMPADQFGPAKITISYFSPKNTNPEVTQFWSGNLKTQECLFTIVSEDGSILAKRSRTLPMPPPNNSARSKLWEELGTEDQALANKAYSEVENLSAAGEETVKLIEQQLNLGNIGTGPFPSGTKEWEIARNIRILELIGSDTAQILLAKIAEDTKGKWPSLFANAAITRLANQPTGPMVKKFGYNRGIPIYDGFLFFDGKYMPAPYVVERWGVDVYINGVLVQRGHDDILGIDVIDRQKDRQETRLKSGQVIFDHTKGGEMSTGKKRGIELIVSLLSGSTGSESGRANRQATFTAGFQSHPQLIQRLKLLGVTLPDDITDTDTGKEPNDTPTASFKIFNEMSKEEQTAESQISQDIWQIREFRNGFRKDFNEVYVKADELVEKYSESPEVIGRIYLEVLIDHALSGLAKPQEAIEYAKKAEQYPLFPKDKAQLYLSWGDSIQSTDPGAKGDALRKVRKKAAEKYLLSVKVLQENNLPETLPDKPIAPPEAFSLDNDEFTIPEDAPPELRRVISEEIAAVEKRDKNRKDYFTALDQWTYKKEIIERAVYSRDLIVNMYAMKPFNTDELKELATGVLGKSEMVDDLISRVENRFKERVQAEISPVSDALSLNHGEKENSAETEIKAQNNNVTKKVNPEDVNEFGASKSEPIYTGFFFHEGKYIDAPYVVELRGLNVYINDILVDKGPVWSLYDYTVETDPGDPPPDISPFNPPPRGVDPRDTYWPKKWRYLKSHFEMDTAKEMMIETYKKSSLFVNVRWQDSSRNIIIIEDAKTGRELNVNLVSSMSESVKNPPPQRIIEIMENNKKQHEKQFLGNSALFKKGGTSTTASGVRALNSLEILLSNSTNEEKIKALEKTGLLWPDDEIGHWIVTDFQSSPQLEERVRMMKAGYDNEAITEMIKKSLESGWSEPQNGLSARVLSTQSYWIPGQTPEVRFQVRNISDKNITIRPLKHENELVNISLCVQLPDRPETGRIMSITHHVGWAPPDPIALKPGESRETLMRVSPSPNESKGALEWEVISELKSPSHPIDDNTRLWQGTIIVSTLVRFYGLTKLPTEQLVSFLNTDYPDHPPVRSELVRRWQLAPPIEARPIQYSNAIRSANSKYVVFFSAIAFDGIGFPTMKGEHLVLVRSDGHVMWSKALDFADFPAVSNDGTVAAAEWLETPPRFRVRIISETGDDVGSYETKPNEAFLKQWTNSKWVRPLFSSIIAIGVSPDGQHVYFATTSEWEGRRLHAINRSGELQWEAILDEVFPFWPGSALRISPDGRHILVADTCHYPSNGFVVFTDNGQKVHTSKILYEDAAFSFEKNVITISDREGTRKVALTEK